MATQAIERARTRIPAATSAIVAWLGAAAFVIAAAWYTLAVRGADGGLSAATRSALPMPQREHIYYRWLATTLPQERFYTAIAITGFLCLAGTAAVARDRLGRDRIGARIAAFLVARGSARWVGQRASFSSAVIAPLA